jgi:uncharacterized Zn-finger protein
MAGYGNTYTYPNLPQPQSAPAQSLDAYPRPYGGFLPPAPVYTNVNNPKGQLALIGGVHAGIMTGFNSGHAASMPHFLDSPSHQQEPANDRPFKCDQCPQSFNRNHDLKRHKRIHMAVKPFPCTHCDKSFSRKDALKVRPQLKLMSQPHMLTLYSDTNLSRAAAKPQAIATTTNAKAIHPTTRPSKWRSTPQFQTTHEIAFSFRETTDHGMQDPT